MIYSPAHCLDGIRVLRWNLPGWLWQIILTNCTIIPNPHLSCNHSKLTGHLNLYNIQYCFKTMFSSSIIILYTYSRILFTSRVSHVEQHTKIKYKNTKLCAQSICNMHFYSAMAPVLGGKLRVDLWSNITPWRQAIILLDTSTASLLNIIIAYF